MQYAVKRSGRGVAYCSISVNGGTRAEGNLPMGTAHFVEHSIFRGTVSRLAEQINSCLDSLGGELNAFTAREEIVLHATTLKEDYRIAVDLLLDLCRNATFPAEEIEVERGVVMDEIIAAADVPSEDIYDEFESRFFEGSPLARRILGTAQTVQQITVEDLKAYYSKVFIPQNMAICIVADIPEEQMQEYVLSNC